jgi:hypothetical protein
MPRPCCKWCSIIITGGLITSSCLIHGTRTETVSSLQNVVDSRNVEQREPYHIENDIMRPTSTTRLESRISVNTASVTQSFSYNIDAWVTTSENG